MGVFDRVDQDAVNVGMHALLKRSNNFFDIGDDNGMGSSSQTENFFDTPSEDMGGGLGLDNNNAPQMDLSDVYDEKAFHIDPRVSKNGWTTGDVPVVENLTFDISPEDIDFSESFSKKIAAYEESQVANPVPQDIPQQQPVVEEVQEEPESVKVNTQDPMITKIRDLVLKIIHKDIRKSIIRSYISRGEKFNDIKLDNEVKNWYWNVGFVDVLINEDLITIVVNRPNKFLGKDNYLHTLRKNLANIGGFRVELQKAPDSDIYKSFFGK